MVLYELDESYCDGNALYGFGRSFDSNTMLSSDPYSNTYNDNHQTHSRSDRPWAQVAETTMPLKASKFAAANQGQFQESIEIRSRQISNRVIQINLVSLLINLILAIIAFYFSFVNNSSATSAFAADCVLDFISSGILLWRYFGDLNSVYMQAREQIACIYLGALFELSGIAIIIKAISDIASGTNPFGDEGDEATYELFYLAIVATIACIVLTVFKCSLYKTLRDNSILLDVINTVVSTVFAMSIVMSQALINVNRSFWYLDPILSIVLATFMMGFGIKVIHQNFNILRPIYGSSFGSNNFITRSYNANGDDESTFAQLLPLSKNGRMRRSNFIISNECAEHLPSNNNNNNHDNNINNSGSYISNLLVSQEQQRPINWQKTDYSTISFN